MKTKCPNPCPQFRALGICQQASEEIHWKFQREDAACRFKRDGHCHNGRMPFAGARVEPEHNLPAYLYRFSP